MRASRPGRGNSIASAAGLPRPVSPEWGTARRHARQVAAIVCSVLHVRAVMLLAPALEAAMLSAPSRADLPDEIQVYDDSLNRPGQFGLEIHANHSFGGETSPGFPGEITSGDATRLTAEFSYGLDTASRRGCTSRGAPAGVEAGGRRCVRGSAALCARLAWRSG